jgi:molecular chaperone GrpE
MTDEQIPVQSEAPAADEPAAASVAPDEAARLREDTARLQKERDEFYELLLRSRADFDNYRKRTDRERLEQMETAAADLVYDLLPIIDDFERALASPGEPGTSADAYRTGVELIHRRLLDLLKTRNVTPIEALGKPFDPRYHQAVVHEAGTGRPEGEVTEEFRRGYMIGSRLLRPSMVKVSAGE